MKHPLWIFPLRLIAQLIRAILLILLFFYRLLISPLLGTACCFQPTCSRYAIAVLQTQSVSHALWLILRRLARCGGGFSGEWDPPPHPPE